MNRRQARAVLRELREEASRQAAAWPGSNIAQRTADYIIDPTPDPPRFARTALYVRHQYDAWHEKLMVYNPHALDGRPAPRYHHAYALIHGQVGPKALTEAQAEDLLMTGLPPVGFEPLDPDATDDPFKGLGVDRDTRAAVERDAAAQATAERSRATARRIIERGG